MLLGKTNSDTNVFCFGFFRCFFSFAFCLRFLLFRFYFCFYALFLFIFIFSFPGFFLYLFLQSVSVFLYVASCLFFWLISLCYGFLLFVSRFLVCFFFSFGVSLCLG
jgi:hypothetical protein